MTTKRQTEEQADWEKRRQEQRPWLNAYFLARQAYRRAQREQPQRCEAVISKFRRSAMTSTLAFEMYDMAGMSVDELRSLADELEALRS